MPIVWDTAGITGIVKISISYEGGKLNTFQTIAESTPNDGEYNWKIGETTSYNCMLKIDPLSEPYTLNGTTEGLFTIGSFLKAAPQHLSLEEPETPTAPENGAVFSIMLNQNPGTGITFNLYSSNPGEFRIVPASVILHSGNWDTGVAVTVTPEYDGVADGDQTGSVLVSTAGDYSAFHAKEVPLVGVTIRDTATALTVHSVSPTYGIVSQDLDINIKGTNFTELTDVYVYLDGMPDWIPVSPVNTIDETTLRCTVNLSMPGDYHLNASGSELKNAFTIVSSSALDTKKAIIVAGSGPFFSNNLWASTEKCAKKAYQSLSFQGYADDNIYFLSRRLNTDVTGDGQNDIDADATSAELETAIKTWVATNTSELLIYMVGPGSDGKFMFESESDPDWLTASTLDSWLDTIDSSISGKIIVIYDAPNAVSFLSPLAGTDRVIITSADEFERTYFLDDGEFSFSYRLFDTLMDNANLSTAYDTVAANMAGIQTPQISVSSGGKRRETQATIIVGRGRITETGPPSVGNAWADPNSLAGGVTASTLSASGITVSTENGGLSRVWARIIPPFETFVSPNAPVIVLPTIKLLDTDADGTYENSYEEFTQNGDYQIFTYAKDRMDYESEPHIITLGQTAGETVDDGDANADREITLADAVLILKILAGEKLNAASDAALGSDGELGLDEVIYILQIVGMLR